MEPKSVHAATQGFITGVTSVKQTQDLNQADEQGSGQPSGDRATIGAGDDKKKEEVPASLASVLGTLKMKGTEAPEDPSREGAPVTVSHPQPQLPPLPRKKVPSYIPPLDKVKLVLTPTTVENLERLSRSYRLSENVLMVGPTGVGKTSLVKYLASVTKNDLRRINLSDMTDVTELIGGYKPDEKGSFRWQDGIILDAIKPKATKDTLLYKDPANEQTLLQEIPQGTSLNYVKQKEVNGEVWSFVETEQGNRGWVKDKHLSADWLLLDEINLADPAILERLNSLFDDDRFVVLTEKQNEVVRAHPTARLFSTMNPTSYSGRKELSEAMLNRLHRFWVKPYPTEELVQIAQEKCSLDKKTLLQMVMTHNAVVDLAVHRQIGKRDGPYPYSLRDFLKWMDRVEKLKGKAPGLKQDQLIYREFLEVYQNRLQNSADRKVVEDALKINFSGSAPPSALPTIEVKGDQLRVGDLTIPVSPESGIFVPGDEANLVHVPSTVRHLNELAKGVVVDEPILLVGNTASGKTSMIRYLAHLTNTNFRRFNLEHHTDVSEFVGGYIPKAGGRPGEFVWKDGILLEAMKPKALVETLLYSHLDLISTSAGKEAELAKSADSSGIAFQAPNGREIRKAQVGESFRWLETKEANGVAWSHVQDNGGKDYWVKDQDIKADWVVFDEINLAQPAILERINSLLDPDRTITLTEKENEVIQAHPSFRIFATMNPPNSKYAGRKDLSLAMRNRFTEHWVNEITDRGELLQIVNFWLRKVPEGKVAAEKMVDFHQTLIAKCEKREIGANVREGLKYTLRNLLYWSRYIKEFSGDRGLSRSFFEGAAHVYADHFSDENDRKAVVDLSRNYLPAPLPAEDQKKAA